MSAERSLPAVISYGPGWLAIDKPSDLSVHNFDSNASQVDVIQIVKELLINNPTLKANVNYTGEFAPAPVHRLDVGTSGVLLVALTRLKARELAEEFANQNTKKTYIAVVKGQVKENTQWIYKLTDKAEGRRNPAGSGDKKPCRTDVQVLQTNKYFSLLKLTIETGRTHQIRRHAALAKHPILGDTRYGDPIYVEKISKIYDVNRMALHAALLSIVIDGKVHILQSSMPDEFLRFGFESFSQEQ